MNSQPGQRPLLQYDGTLGELYGIFIKNFLLSIVTLGIYRFWATTRMRRYVWSRMRFQNERFEYTGTGGELFKGFLLACGAVIVLMVVAFGLGAVLGHLTGSKLLQVLPVLIAYLFLVVVAAGAYFSAQRYRLSRTQWCGIRGGMTGSALAYGARVLLYGLLCVVTLGQLAPWTAMRLTERRINASSFGTQHFGFQGRAGALYPTFLGTFVGMVVLAVVLGAIFLRQGFAVMRATSDATMQHGHLPPGAVFSFVAFYVLFIVGAALLRCFYLALVVRHVTGNTTLGSQLRFGSLVTGPSLLRLVVSNLAILIFTLGFGYPIALHRALRFSADTLVVQGSIDPQSLGQNEALAPRTGEGMLNLLDHGGAF